MGYFRMALVIINALQHPFNQISKNIVKNFKKVLCTTSGQEAASFWKSILTDGSILGQPIYRF